MGMLALTDLGVHLNRQHCNIKRGQPRPCLDPIYLKNVNRSSRCEIGP